MPQFYLPRLSHLRAAQVGAFYVQALCFEQSNSESAQASSSSVYLSSLNCIFFVALNYHLCKIDHAHLVGHLQVARFESWVQ